MYFSRTNILMNFDIFLSKEQCEGRNTKQHTSAIQIKSSIEISERFNYDTPSDKNNLHDALEKPPVLRLAQVY